MDVKIISGLEFLFSNKNKNADTLLESKHYQNKKSSQLNVETLVDISNDLIKNKL